MDDGIGDLEGIDGISVEWQWPLLDGRGLCLKGRRTSLPQD